MQKHLFLRIVDALQSCCEFFQLRTDALGRRALLLLTKCNVVIRMLVCGISADCVDEYLKIGESTTMECMKNFAAGVIQVFRKSIYEDQLKLMLIVCWWWRKPVISWYARKY